MKTLIRLLIVALSASSAIAFADVIQNIPQTQINVGRVLKVYDLGYEKSNDTINFTKVNVVVEDIGGSTDLSPTQNIYLTLYAKGEMFSTDAAFKLGSFYDINAANRLGEGVYEIFVEGIDYKGEWVVSRYVIDAKKALAEMKAVNCGDEFDCETSEKFTSTVVLAKANM